MHTVKPKLALHSFMRLRYVFKATLGQRETFWHAETNAFVHRAQSSILPPSLHSLEVVAALFVSCLCCEDLKGKVVDNRKMFD